MYLPDEVQLFDWMFDADALSNSCYGMFSVSVGDLAWFPNKSSVLNIPSCDFL